MKKFLSVLLTLVLLITLVGPSIALASTPKLNEKVKVTEVLFEGTKRLSKYTKTVVKDVTTRLVDRKDSKGKTFKVWESVIEYEATTSLLPQTLEDLETKIICDWTSFTDSIGTTYYENGNNLFLAKVTGSRVSMEYNGKQAAWDPIVRIDGEPIPISQGPLVTPDPINPNYTNNTLKWIYSGKIGNLLSSRTVTITRYLRQIEGALIEYYYLEKNPQGTVEIDSRYETELGFIQAGDTFAYDKENKSLLIQGDKNLKSIGKLELNRPDVVYPVIIDPTIPISVSIDDGQLSAYSFSSYAAARTAATGQLAPYDTGYFGQKYNSYPVWDIYRFMLFFDTSSIPSEGNISEAYISLKVVTNGFAVTPFSIVAQTGGATYPHVPPVVGDYLHTNYSGDGGSFLSSSTVSGQYFNIDLNSTGIGWINKGEDALTKFLLRSSRDIAGTAPTGSEYLSLYCYEKGTGYEPKLTITYTVIVASPIVTTSAAEEVTGTSAKFTGTLTSDGGAPSNVGFVYGLTTACVGGTLDGPGGYITGQSWSLTANDLSYGTLYYFSASAQNSAGPSVADVESFLTKPNTPTGFSATPGNIKNDLAWTKGTGSNKTMVRRGTTGYPTSATDGTQVYFDTGATYTDTPLTNGTTYYYSTFGEQSSGALQQYSASAANTSGVPVTVSVPIMDTYAATGVGTTSATFNGFLTSLGGNADTDCRFEYGLTGGWELGETAGPTTLTEPGSFSKPMAGLLAATLYHYRAKGTNDTGDGYGPDATVTTGQPSAPTITTDSEVGVTQTGATLWLTVTSDGDAVTQCWFKWGTSGSYGHTTSPISDPMYTGNKYSYPLTGLEPGVLYHYQGVGENSINIGYGADGTFTTDSPNAPAVTTTAASNVGATSATLNAILDNGDGVTCEMRFQYSDTGDFTGEEVSTGWVAGQVTGSVFSHTVHSLSINTLYYARAQAKNITGTTTGGEVEFTTVFLPPTNFTASPLSSSSISITFVKLGDKTLIIGKTGSYPADRLDGEQVYFGSDESTTYNNLLPGVTYYFRAWAFQAPATYSVTYSEDACTTPSGVVSSEPSVPTLSLENPTTFSWMYQEPSSSKIQKWPGVSIIDGISTSTGIPKPTMWGVFVSGFILILILIGLALVTKDAFIVIMGLAGSTVVLALIGIFWGWVAIGFVVVFGLLSLAKAKGG